MHRTAQLLRQDGMDAALALDAADAVKGGRHHANMEMGLALAAIRARCAGMAGMAMAFVRDFDKGRRESGDQFPLNGVCNAHAGEGRDAGA